MVNLCRTRGEDNGRCSLVREPCRSGSFRLSTFRRYGVSDSPIGVVWGRRPVVTVRHRRMAAGLPVVGELSIEGESERHARNC
jgi:hypothetical protein